MFFLLTRNTNSNIYPNVCLQCQGFEINIDEI